MVIESTTSTLTALQSLQCDTTKDFNCGHRVDYVDSDYFTVTSRALFVANESTTSTRPAFQSRGSKGEVIDVTIGPLTRDS